MPRDNRVYITLHNGMPEHRKVDALSDGAFRLLIDLWCLCSRNEWDGKVPAATWAKRGTPKARAELLVELAEPQPDGSIYMHDYLEHQRSKDEIHEMRMKRAEAGSKGGKATASAKASAAPSAKAKSKQASSKTPAETETDTTTELATARSAAPFIAEWLEHCSERPPERVIGQAAKEVRGLLSEGIDDRHIRAGLADWHFKGQHPATLPSFVNAAMQARSRSTTNQRVDVARELSQLYAAEEAANAQV